MQSRRARVAALMALLGVLGCAATAGAPESTHYAGLWPVGLGSGVLLYAGPAPRGRARLAAVLGLVVLAALVLGGYPWDVSVGYAVGVTLECLVVHQVLTGRWGSRRLTDDQDLVRLAAACGLGALVGAALFGATSAATDFGVAGRVALATFFTHVTSQLILLGLFMEELRHPGFGGRAERTVRWTLALAVTVAAFLPTTVPSLVFLVLPLIGWTALRSPMREALWQLVVVCGIAATLTSLGYGPFVSIYAIRDRSPELAAAPLQGFMLGCALVCIPFAMAVGRQRSSATEADHERERLLRIVEGAIGTVIIESDPVGRITLFNSGAQAILGYSEEEVLGRTPAMFFTDEEIARHAALLGVPADLMQVSLASSLPENGPRDWNYRARDGQVRTLSANVVPITDHDRVVGYLATGDDITARADAQATLETALTAERRAVANLTEIDRTKDAFVSSVSHELRTPITNIVGYLELLLDGAYGATTAPQHEALGRIDSNSHRLLELIDDLLTLSQIETLDVAAKRQPVDLREVVRRVASEVRHDLLVHGQHLDLELPTEPAVVLGDQAHLLRMVSNLATNAVKFTPAGGLITLRVTATAATYTVEVQDTGVGIPDEEQALLFNRF
ncbi:MAG: histidine kinase dimerization/phospho-acceptor domain-containing protein, partial [Marmoricola sp.]